jgi:transcription-repair coupling factor (superfamily II helicase)
MRELERHGQVFVLHNNVAELPKLAGRLKKRVGRARVAVAHGQLEGAELEQTLREFGEREHDVLVCSTIIESGVNFPNANSIVIRDAHRFGLSQLYQIRGRVGRADRQAYCYLMIPGQKKGELTDKAQRRLETIRTFTDLGSGFQVALQDLEIRGAGDLLGESQSGQIVRIGYVLYSQLLTQALIGDEAEEATPRCVVDLPVETYIPTEYLLEVSARMEIYRRLFALRKPAQIDKLQDEVADRFGAPPAPVLALFTLARLRLLAARLEITAIHLQERFGEASIVCEGPSPRELPKAPRGPGVLDFICRALAE